MNLKHSHRSRGVVVATVGILISACSSSTPNQMNGGGGNGGGSNGSSSDGGSVSSGGEGSSGSSDGGGVGSSSGVTILVYPNGNHASELIAAIKGAKTSVYMTMYEIDDYGRHRRDGREAKGAGLDVQVDPRRLVDDDGRTTLSAYNCVQFSAKIPVVWSSSAFTFTHEKCVMIDHKQAWIMTANAESSVPSSTTASILAIDNDLRPT